MFDVSSVAGFGRLGANNVWGDGLNWRARQEYDEDLQSAHSTVASFVEQTEFQTKSYSADFLVTANYKINHN